MRTEPLDYRALRTTEELAAEYCAFAAQSQERSVDLGHWLPSLRRWCRPLVPGELAFVVANTGVGKSAALQNIAMIPHTYGTLFFELELPNTMLFERFLALGWKRQCVEIEAVARERPDDLKVAASMHLSPADIVTCDLTRLSMDDMRRIILDAYPSKMALEGRVAKPPLLVCVDYVGLMAAQGRSRYERVSSAAEDLKVLAKETQTVIVAATQRNRPEDGDISVEVGLHDGKDSGSIEASAGLMIGMWRDANDPRGKGWARVLKNSKGPSGEDCTVPLAIGLDRMCIAEAARSWQQHVMEVDER